MVEESIPSARPRGKLLPIKQTFKEKVIANHLVGHSRNGTQRTLEKIERKVLQGSHSVESNAVVSFHRRLLLSTAQVRVIPDVGWVPSEGLSRQRHKHLQWIQTGLDCGGRDSARCDSQYNSLISSDRAFSHSFATSLSEPIPSSLEKE